MHQGVWLLGKEREGAELGRKTHKISRAMGLRGGGGLKETHTAFCCFFTRCSWAQLLRRLFQNPPHLQLNQGAAVLGEQRGRGLAPTAAHTWGLSAPGGTMDGAAKPLLGILV